jgi:hypothetical protein
MSGIVSLTADRTGTIYANNIPLANMTTVKNGANQTINRLNSTVNTSINVSNTLTLLSNNDQANIILYDLLSDDSVSTGFTKVLCSTTLNPSKIIKGSFFGGYDTMIMNGISNATLVWSGSEWIPILKDLNVKFVQSQQEISTTITLYNEAIGVSWAAPTGFDLFPVIPTYTITYINNTTNASTSFTTKSLSMIILGLDNATSYTLSLSYSNLTTVSSPRVISTNATPSSEYSNPIPVSGPVNSCLVGNNAVVNISSGNTITFTQPNLYSGTTNIYNNSSLIINKEGGLGSSSVVISENGVLNGNNTDIINSITLNGNGGKISDSIIHSLSGNGTLTVGGHLRFHDLASYYSSYGGIITIPGGATLDISTNGTFNGGSEIDLFTGSTLNLYTNYMTPIVDKAPGYILNSNGFSYMN